MMARRRAAVFAACLASACDPATPAPPDARPAADVTADAAPDVAAPEGYETRADPEVRAMVDAVSDDEVAGSIRALAGFETRNTCSATDDPARGIGAARAWIQGRFEALPGVRVRQHPYTVTDCASGASRQLNVVAWIPGAQHPERLVVLGGHYDSLGSASFTGVIDGALPAPGANDSGSQTAVLLEVARAMAGRRFDATVVFVAFSGEEQGLYGSSAFVGERGALFPGARVEAMLDCDIVGGDAAANDEASLGRFRLYSPGTPRESGGLRTQSPERVGTADDTSPSRGLMRAVGTWGALYVPAMAMDERLREDRPGRGGDHQPFLGAGIPAVRFIEARENAAHQHNALDTPENLAPGYAARVARVVTAVAASLARAPAAPASLAVTRDGASLALAWAPPDGAAVARWVVAARPVTANRYARGVAVTPGREARVAVEALGVGGEAFFVSVAAVDADGHESLFAYPEWRCDADGCAVQEGSLAVTDTRSL